MCFLSSSFIWKAFWDMRRPHLAFVDLRTSPRCVRNILRGFFLQKPDLLFQHLWEAFWDLESLYWVPIVYIKIIMCHCSKAKLSWWPLWRQKGMIKNKHIKQIRWIGWILKKMRHTIDIFHHNSSNSMQGSWEAWLQSFIYLKKKSLFYYCFMKSNSLNWKPIKGISPMHIIYPICELKSCIHSFDSEGVYDFEAATVSANNYFGGPFELSIISDILEESCQPSGSWAFPNNFEWIHRIPVQ